MNEKSIFAAALERKSTGERQAFLQEACGENAQLRAHVEALLQADTEAGSFLAHPPAGIDATTGTNAAGHHTSDSESVGPSLPLLEPCDKPDRIGKLVGKAGEYEIIEIVGQGGMGTVLRAFDTKLSRVVAVKVMAAELAASPTAVRRFLREATTAAAVVHNHVVTIHAVDDSHRPPFLVMEYIDGQTLQQKIDREGALQLKTILRIGAQAAAGLAAAHNTGLIHRDVKPGNILLENGVERVKITDFGLARAADDLEMTKAGMIAGTPQYMSPEQAKGEPIDARSDLFSLGSVLYTMCTGRPAFRAETTMGVLKRVCEDEPRPIHEVNPEIPEWLASIVNKLLAKSPADRFQSSAEVTELLSQSLAHVQQSGSGVPPAIFVGSALRGVPRAGRNATEGVPYSASRRWSLAAALLLLVTTALALAETTGVTNVAATVIRIVRGDGTLVVEIDDPNIQVLLDGEELVITGAGPKELRLRPGQHELQTVKAGKPSDTKLVTITRDGRQVVKVAREHPTPAAPVAPTTRIVWANAASGDGSVSPDGRYFAFVDRDRRGVLAVRNLATGENRQLTTKRTSSESSESEVSPVFSPDGKRLAYTWYKSEGEQTWKYDLRVVEIEGGEPKSLHSNTESYPEAYGWSPDGKSILAGLYLKAQQLQIAFIGVSDGSLRIVKSLDRRSSNVGHISLAPDGRTIAYSRRAEARSANRSIFLIDVESGRETQAMTHAANTDVLAWTPDGRRVLFTIERQGARDAWAMPIADGKPQGAPELVKVDLGIVSPLGVASNGAFYYGQGFGLSSIYTAALDLEKEAVTAIPLPGESFSVKDDLSVVGWSPDGQYLAYKARTRARLPEIRVVSSKNSQTRVLQPDFNYFSSIHWSHDGKSIIFAKPKGPRGPSGIYQIDASTGNVTTVVEPADGPEIARAYWSADGRGIVYLKGRNGIIHRDLQTKREREILAPGNSDFQNFRFDVSPDGRHVAVMGWPESTDGLILRLIPVDGGASRDLLTDKHKTGLGWVTWAPNGKFLLFNRYGPDDKLAGLWYVSVDGGEARKLQLSGVQDRAVLNIAIHPDGNQLAFTTFASRNSEVWALENFLPPLADSKSSAAEDASAAKYKSAAATDSTPAVASQEQQTPADATTRRVWANAVDDTFSGVPSPDGKYISYVDWQSGDVGVHELATGKNRRLMNQGYPEYGLSPIFSPDSQQVAYYWLNKEKEVELRTIGVDGNGPRVVYHQKEKDVGVLWLRDWSADGKYILATFDNKKTVQLGLVSVEDGSVRVLKTLDRGVSGKMSLSPDGRYVAYTYRQQKNSPKHDIFLLPTDGSGEVPLVVHQADDFVLGWAPDGKGLLFASDRTGQTGAWLIPVAEGKPQGAAELVKPEMGQFQPLGLTRSGSLYYGVFSGGQNVYTATLDLEKGHVLSPPVEAMQRVEGTNWSPAWSPDGKYLACLSHATHQSRPPFFYIRSMDSNEVRELEPNLRSFHVHSLNWSPDGSGLLGAGSNEEGDWGALRVDVQSGAVTTLLPGAGSVLYAPIPAPDGKTIFYQRYNPTRRLIRRDLETAVEQELYQTSDRAQWWSLAPDGQQLAFSVGGALKLLPAAGGKPKELTKMEENISAVAWMPNGRHLLFQRASQLWRIPVSGGEPQATGLTMKGGLGHLRVHPDGRQIAFSAHSPQPDKTEVWVLENFLPPLKDSAAGTAADASATKSE